MKQKQKKIIFFPSSHKSILNILHYGTINLCFNMKHNNPRLQQLFRRRSCRKFSSHTTNNIERTYITNEVLRH